MLSRFLSTTLLLLCGVGLLFAWMLDGLVWRSFEALVFLLLAIWMAGWAAGRLEARWSWLFLPFLGIMAYGVVQLALGWTAYAFATATDLIRWGCYLAVFFLAFQLFGKRGSGGRFRRVFAIYAFALAVVSVLQYFAGNGKIYWLFQPPATDVAGLGPFLNRDQYASFIALAIAAAGFEMVRRPRHRWVFAIATAALYASVIAGASRAGFVLLTMELVLLFVLLGFSGRGALAVVGLVVAFGFVVGWETLYERLRIPDPYAGRREMAGATLGMIKSNPWKGYGLGTWTYVYPAHAERDFGVFVNAAHNDWLQWTAEGGIPVLACLLALLCGILAFVPRAPWALGVPIVFLHSLIDFPMQGRFLPATVFLMAGVAAAQVRRRRKEWQAPEPAPADNY
jgi:O-antigen ligase